MITHERGGLLACLDRRRVEDLLGGPLPVAARGIRFAVWQPSSSLAYHEAVVRFDASLDDYRVFVSTLDLEPFSRSGPNVHLPVDWSPPAGIERPDWWQATADTPPDAASGRLGPFGSVAVKWEDGLVYVLIVDTGHRDGQPPPGR